MERQTCRNVADLRQEAISCLHALLGCAHLRNRKDGQEGALGQEKEEEREREREVGGRLRDVRRRMSREGRVQRKRK